MLLITLSLPFEMIFMGFVGAQSGVDNVEKVERSKPFVEAPNPKLSQSLPPSQVRLTLGFYV